MKKSESGARVRAIRDPRLQDEIVRVVRARDVPLLAVDAVSALRARAPWSRPIASEPEPLSVIA